MARPNTAQDASAGIVTLIDSLLDRAIRMRASDVHFEPTDAGIAVRFRIDGHLVDVEQIPIVLLPNVVSRLKVQASLLSYRVDIPQEGAVTRNVDDRSYDLRISTFPTIRGERVAVRILPRGAHARALDDLGLSENVRTQMWRAAVQGDGLICLCGPAGSGKTTTLYALLDRLRMERPTASFVTIEDPVEFRLDGVAQIQVSAHGELTFERALRSLLRQDPQVLLVGEIRDRQTAAVAVEAALTGHLVLTSFHSGATSDAIVRLLEMGIPPYQLTSALRLVVCQRLLRTICPACGAHRPADDTAVCETCLGVGYQGRTACAEAIRLDTALRAAILERSPADQLRRIIHDQPAFATLAEDAQRHVNAGHTTQAEADALRCSRDREGD
ncbi:MAG TPA: GspE/PulE family protein [Phycisphaerae bacterium]|nr:GspE/PulE family protein [Phycisphaerae bacterium]HRW53701.1 GspE/PulE family protein [Phycisphaerae bacterium]